MKPSPPSTTCVAEHVVTYSAAVPARMTRALVCIAMPSRVTSRRTLARTSRVTSGYAAGLLVIALTLVMPSRAFAQTDIRCLPATAASQCLKAWLASEQQVSAADVSVIDLHGDVPDASALQLARSAPAARMQALVTGARGEARVHWFRVHLYREVEVWTRDAAAGADLRAAKPARRRVDVANLPAYLTARTDPGAAGSAFPDIPSQSTSVSASDFANTTLRRAVRAGEPVLRADLKTASDISAGDVVRFAVSDNRIAITGLGRALEDGNAGQTLRVLRTHTGQTITAIVLGKP